MTYCRFIVIRVHTCISAVPYGPWWQHNLEFWMNRDHENILFIRYEDLQRVRKRHTEIAVKNCNRVIFHS